VERFDVKYISGDFAEGQEVTLLINGTEVTRKVRYNNMDGLYVMYKNMKYFHSECDFSKYYE
jgi:uncharacterized protein YacL (UPF0231 family)